MQHNGEAYALKIFKYQDYLDGYEDYFASLSGMEQERALKYRFDFHKQRYVIAHGYVRSWLQDQNIDSSLLGYRQSGKFDFTTGAHHLSLSYSKDYIALACALQPLGVDIEIASSHSDQEGLVRMIMSEFEWRQYQQQKDAKEKQQWFYRCWTHKEAYLKKTQEGLSRDLKTIDTYSQKLAFSVQKPYDLDENIFIALAGDNLDGQR